VFNTMTRRFRGAALGACVLLGVISTCQASGTEADTKARRRRLETVQQIIDGREDIVTKVGDEIVKMSANGCEDLDCGPRDPDDPYSISCGQHYCNSAFTGQTCADDLGKNPACLSSCSTQEVNYDEGYWRTAPGMFNDPLARQDICRYRGLQNVLPTLQRFDNDLGQQTDLWTYLGTTHGVTDMWPGRPRERTAGGTVDEACVPFDPRIRPWYTTASSPQDRGLDARPVDLDEREESLQIDARSRRAHARHPHGV